MSIHTFESLRSETTQAETDFRRLFAARLNAALDQHMSVPRGYGRGQAVAGMFGITRITAGKWLAGEGLPDLWRLPQLARLLNVDTNELVGGTVRALESDDRYMSINMHNQDHPDKRIPMYLPASSLQGNLVTPGCLLMQLSTNDMVGYAGVGDMVIYNPDVQWISAGTDVYILRVQGHYVLRRATRTLRGEIVLTTEANSGQELFKDADFTSALDGPTDLIAVVGRVQGRILLRGATA